MGSDVSVTLVLESRVTLRYPLYPSLGSGFQEFEERFTLFLRFFDMNRLKALIFSFNLCI